MDEAEEEEEEEKSIRDNALRPKRLGLGKRLNAKIPIRRRGTPSIATKKHRERERGGGGGGGGGGGQRCRYLGLTFERQGLPLVAQPLPR